MLQILFLSLHVNIIITMQNYKKIFLWQIKMKKKAENDPLGLLREPS